MKEDRQEASSTKTTNKPKEESRDKEGFPAIADLKKAEPKMVLIVAALIMVGLYGWWHGRHPQAQKPAATEAFQVQGTAAPLTVNDNGSNAVGHPVSTSSLDTTQASIAAANAENAQKALIARIQAPMMVVGQNASSSDTINASNTTNKTPLSDDPNTQFLNQVSDQTVQTNNATMLSHRDTLIAQGTLIHATLETAINSDLPGYLRAMVSYPVYSEDGSRALIPAGSRLIGQYKSRMAEGQSRIFIVWTRVITPNGISVALGSPGVDSLGIAGLAADKIDTHFWQMFGTATLLSVLGAGASNMGVNAGDQYNASQAYRQSIAQSLAQTSQNTLEQKTMIPPTLHINQGKAILVFVAKDLQFGKAMPTKMQEISVF